MTAFPLTLDDSVAMATDIVLARFDAPRAAWLGGSVVRGEATATSDLDISVLVDSSPPESGRPVAPMRHSFLHEAVPVELFVHDEATLQQSRDRDRERRQPTQQRLVGETVILLDTDGIAERLRAECLAEIAAGPAALPRAEIDRLRYGLSDLLDDYTGLPQDRLLERYFPAHLFDRSTQLLLAHENAWQGSGKGLIAAVRHWAHDTDRRRPSGAGWSQWVEEWSPALRAADPFVVTRLVTEVLDHCGGRLWVGHLVGGEPSETMGGTASP